MTHKHPAYLCFQTYDPKRDSFAGTIDAAVRRYQARYGNPDHIVVSPQRKDTLGSEVQSGGLRLDVLAHRIIAHNDVLVGVTDPAIHFFKETN